jgi:hypothetical protein
VVLPFDHRFAQFGKIAVPIVNLCNGGDDAVGLVRDAAELVIEEAFNDMWRYSKFGKASCEGAPQIMQDPMSAAVR